MNTPDDFHKYTKQSQCVEWHGPLDGAGYGLFFMQGKMFRAHRYAWERENGPIPEGLQALHACDNRRCVNPAHIFLGTNEMNIQDRHAKGRDKRWKLSPARADLIRFQATTQRDLARCFGVSQSLVSLIRNREIWGQPCA